MATPVQSFISTLGFGKEASTGWGTGVVPTFVLPFPSGAKGHDIPIEVEDKSYRGNAAMLQGLQQTFFTGDYDIGEQYFYPDVSGNLLMSIMGTDTPTTSASTTSHAITLLAGQTPSYSINDYDGISNRRYAGMRCEELTLKYAAAGEFKVGAKFTGLASATAATYSVAQTSLVPFKPSDAALTLNGSGDTTLETLDLTLKRKHNVIPTANGTTAPTLASIDVLDVTGKATLVLPTYTDLNLFENNTQGAFSLVLTASTTNILTVQMTKCAFRNPTEIDRSKTYVTLNASFSGVYNATDAGPIKFVLQNATTASY